MTVRNKWNKKSYKVVKTDEKIVTLERENGEQFTIQKSEFNFTYVVEKGE